MLRGFVRNRLRLVRLSERMLGFHPGEKGSTPLRGAKEIIMKEDGFEARERLGQAYWDDPRWEQVRKLRQEGRHPEANHLVFEIDESWGLD
jgi:hypothetical protein